MYQLYLKILVCVIPLVGCIRTLIVNKVSDELVSHVSILEKQTDTGIALPAIAAQIPLMEMLYQQSPNKKLAALLSQAITSWSFATYEPELFLDPMSSLKVNASRNYLVAKEWSLKSLPPCAATMDAACISKIKDVRALYWYVFSSFAYARHHLDKMDVLSSISILEKALNRIIELDESHHGGGVYLLSMAFYGSRPKIMGGDPKMVENSYRKLKEIHRNNPPFLIADVFYGLYGLVPKQDKESFVKLYESVMKSETNSPFGVFNALSQDIAKKYLNNLDEVFL